MPDLTHTKAYRAVFGAVRNVLDGHPQWVVPDDFGRSVAKRAAGTMMALAKDEAPSLLAAARQSGQRGRLRSGARSGAGPLVLTAQLSRAHQTLTGLIVDAHKKGDHGRYIELITAARIVKRELARHEDATSPPAPAPEST